MRNLVKFALESILESGCTQDFDKLLAMAVELYPTPAIHPHEQPSK